MMTGRTVGEFTKHLDQWLAAYADTAAERLLLADRMAALPSWQTIAHQWLAGASYRVVDALLSVALRELLHERRHQETT